MSLVGFPFQTWKQQPSFTYCLCIFTRSAMSHAASALALRIRKYGGAVVNTVISQQKVQILSESLNPQAFLSSFSLGTLASSDSPETSMLG